jgi:hypothetical protein
LTEQRWHNKDIHKKRTLFRFGGISPGRPEYYKRVQQILSHQLTQDWKEELKYTY